MKYFTNKKINFYRGFSLLEVIVTLAILGMMAGLVLFNYPKLTQTLAFRNASDQLFFGLKSAQVTGSSRGGDYRGDGIFIDTTVSNSNFSEFQDKQVLHHLHSKSTHEIVLRMTDEEFYQYFIID